MHFLVLLASVELMIVAAINRPIFPYATQKYQIDSKKIGDIGQCWAKAVTQRSVKIVLHLQTNVYTNLEKGIDSFNRIFNGKFQIRAPVKSKQTSISENIPVTTITKLSGGKDRKKNVLILMSDTGGGHRASAEALDQALEQRYPGKFSVNIMDIWTDHAKPPFNSFVPTYRYVAKHPILWRGLYAYGQFPLTKKFTEVWSWIKCYDSFRRAINSTNPDIVVSVHPLCQLMPISIVNELNKERPSGKLPISFVTVVTDLGGAHSTWFDKRADACFVPSESVRKIALQNGVPSEKILLRGLPVRPSFWKSSAQSKNSIRVSLGLQKECKTALLMGGGDGVGGIKEITAEIASTLGNWKKASQLIVICGHNRKLSDQLRSKTWAPNVNVVVKEFVPNVDEYMAASDCLISKAGPGTIAEAMIRGLPIILSSFLPGQV